MNTRLIKRAILGADRVGHYEDKRLDGPAASWLSASFDSESGLAIKARIHFPDGDHISRHVVEMDREAMEHMRDSLAAWLERKN